MLPESPVPGADQRSRAAFPASGRLGGPAEPVPQAPGLVNTKQSARATALTLENSPESNARRRAARCSNRTVTRARLHDESVHKGGRRGRWLLVTPTYRDESTWHPGDIRDCLHRMREWARRLGVKLSYAWVMELTKRGRPHYHLIVFLPRHLHLPCFDKRGWWRKGLTKTEVARNPVGYLAKYASKGFGACDPETDLEYLYPRGARISGGSVVDPAQRPEWSYWSAPRWARERCEGVTHLRRVAGGFVVVDTGEYLASPWRFVGISPDGKHLLFVVRDDGLTPAAPGHLSATERLRRSSWQSLSSNASPPQ